MGHPVSFFQIQGKDGSSLIAFYKQVFGWKTDLMPDGSAMVAPEKDGIAGTVGAVQQGDRSVTVYVTVSNVDAHLQRIAAAGGQVVMPKMVLPNDLGAIGGFLDPAGNWVGVWEPGKSAAPAAPRKAARKKPAKKAAARKKPAKKAPRKVARKKGKGGKAARRRR